jgi:hypothetical protein
MSTKPREVIYGCRIPRGAQIRADGAPAGSSIGDPTQIGSLY